MSISTHDSIDSTPVVVHALDKFLKYVNEHPGGWFARKDDTAE